MYFNWVTLIGHIHTNKKFCPPPSPLPPGSHILTKVPNCYHTHTLGSSDNAIKFIMSLNTKLLYFSTVRRIALITKLNSFTYFCWPPTSFYFLNVEDFQIPLPNSSNLHTNISKRTTQLLCFWNPQYRDLDQENGKRGYVYPLGAAFADPIFWN